MRLILNVDIYRKAIDLMVKHCYDNSQANNIMISVPASNALLTKALNDSVMNYNGKDEKSSHNGRGRFYDTLYFETTRKKFEENTSLKSESIDYTPSVVDHKKFLTKFFDRDETKTIKDGSITIFPTFYSNLMHSYKIVKDDRTLEYISCENSEWDESCIIEFDEEQAGKDKREKTKAIGMVADELFTSAGMLSIRTDILSNEKEKFALFRDNKFKEISVRHESCLEGPNYEDVHILVKKNPSVK